MRSYSILHTLRLRLVTNLAKAEIGRKRESIERERREVDWEGGRREEGWGGLWFPAPFLVEAGLGPTSPRHTQLLHPLGLGNTLLPPLPQHAGLLRKKSAKTAT